MSPYFFSRVYFSRYFYSIVRFSPFFIKKSYTSQNYYFSDFYHHNRFFGKNNIKNIPNSTDFYQNAIKSTRSQHFFFPKVVFLQGFYFDYSFIKYQNLKDFNQRFFIFFLRLFFSKLKTSNFKFFALIFSAFKK